MGSRSYSSDEGEKLVKAARQAIELSIVSPRFNKRMLYPYIKEFDDDIGVVVRIMHYGTLESRGSCTSLFSSEPLGNKLITAAISAASPDPRHVPVSYLEFDHILVSVNLVKSAEKATTLLAGGQNLSIPPFKGLMVKLGFSAGVLLPGDAAALGMGADSLMAALCSNAGIPLSALKRKDLELYLVEVQTFSEVFPGGRIEEGPVK